MKKWLILALLTLSSIAHAEMNWDAYVATTLKHQDQVEGWCTDEKSKAMMELIRMVKPEVCVEIGVFGGASIYPTARALRYNKKGVVYAIDPWRHIDCQEGYDADDVNYQWWTQVDLERIYRGFLIMLKRFRLVDYCKVIRGTSVEALPEFEDGSIDILHIDGNHSELTSLRDVRNYLPKVKSGGYIWMDDANWPTTQRAVEELTERCEPIEDWTVHGSSLCLLFRVK